MTGEGAFKRGRAVNVGERWAGLKGFSVLVVFTKDWFRQTGGPTKLKENSRRTSLPHRGRSFGAARVTQAAQKPSSLLLSPSPSLHPTLQLTVFYPSVSRSSEYHVPPRLCRPPLRSADEVPLHSLWRRLPLSEGPRDAPEALPPFARSPSSRCRDRNMMIQ